MRREMPLCLAAGLLGGGLVLLGARQPWDASAASAPAAGLVAGGGVNPVGSLVSTLGAVLLLGTLVVAVTRTVGRRLAGVVVLLAAVAAAAVAAGADGGWSVWRAAVPAGALLAAPAGVLAAVRGPRWAAMGRRYDAPSAPRPAHESDPWRALDRGDDPTV